ncbi:MAG: hypothetical protein ACI85Q_000630 [Salibacteraceae bacterium]|jgi:hypothetical protein
MWYDKTIFEKGLLTSINSKGILLLWPLFLLILGLSSSTPHPYHVSYTEIEFKEESRNLTFSIDVFTDDLETAIKLDYKPEKFFLGEGTINSANDSLIQLYVQNKTTILMDGVVLKGFSFLPTESNPDRTTIYFQFTDLPSFSSLTYYTSVLNHVFQDQQNIVAYKRGTQTQKALLSSEKTNATWTR